MRGEPYTDTEYQYRHSIAAGSAPRQSLSKKLSSSIAELHGFGMQPKRPGERVPCQLYFALFNLHFSLLINRGAAQAARRGASGPCRFPETRTKSYGPPGDDRGSAFSRPSLPHGGIAPDNSP